MEFEHYLLHVLLALPLVGAIVVALQGPKRQTAVRRISLGVSLVIAFCSFILAGRFMALERPWTAPQKPTERISTTFQPEFVPGLKSTALHDAGTDWDLIPLGAGTVQFYLGVDGINLFLIVLTAVLFPPCVLISWNQVHERVNEFYAWLLALQTCVLGVFMAFDIVLFYVFFELSLVPLFFLIGIWGGPERRYAARKFFVYTLTGSLLTLLGIMGVVLAVYSRTHVLTFSIPELVVLVNQQLAIQDSESRAYWLSIQMVVFSLLVAGFAVKVPLVPFHTWLPLAHVEAPTAGSVDLAGLLLKIGVYGFLRLCIPLTPDVSLAWGLPLVTVLAVIGIIYGAFCAYAQDDVKKLIAYSSISHLGLCMAAVYSLTATGLAGGLFQMVNHGLSTGLLFLLIGMLYERYHTRMLQDYSGMATRLPLFGFCLMFAVLSSVGLPGLNGFVGEALCFFGIMEEETTYGGGPFFAVVALSGMVLGAWYLITMVRRLLFGPLKEPHHDGPAIPDMEPREWATFLPLAALCLLLGLYPHPFLATSQPDVDRLAHLADAARQRQQQDVQARR
ncbi:MAG: NADH-quinone oxidoreductase subunit M [Planctomycetes bacterium]|nr:NADH-quinone oxidoreductase subunit M [Planctomycetota bacterium]